MNGKRGEEEKGTKPRSTSYTDTRIAKEFDRQMANIKHRKAFKDPSVLFSFLPKLLRAPLQHSTWYGFLKSMPQWAPPGTLLQRTEMTFVQMGDSRNARGARMIVRSNWWVFKMMALMMDAIRRTKIAYYEWVSRASFIQCWRREHRRHPSFLCESIRRLCLGTAIGLTRVFSLGWNYA